MEEFFDFPGYHDCVQSIRELGKIVEWTADGITWEADPRHAELRKSFGGTGRSVTTQGVRDKLTDIEGYYGLVRTTSQMFGLKSLLLDWGWKFHGACLRQDWH